MKHFITSFVLISLIFNNSYAFSFKSGLSIAGELDPTGAVNMANSVYNTVGYLKDVQVTKPQWKTLNDKVVSEDSGLIVINLLDYIEDPLVKRYDALPRPINTIKYKYSGTNSLLDIKSVAGVMSLTPIANRFGTMEFEVEAIYSKSPITPELSSSTTFKVIVNPINDLPELIKTSFENNEITTAEDNIFIIDFDGVDIEDGRSIFYSIDGTDADKFVLNTNTGELKFKNVPDFDNPTDSDENNIYNFNLNLKDQDDAVETTVLSVKVIQNSNPPVATDIPAVNIEEEKKYYISLNKYFSDSENSKLLYSVENSSEIADVKVLNDTLLIDAQKDKFGQFDFNITASDGKFTVSKIVNVTVENINDLPDLNISMDNARVVPNIKELQKLVSNDIASYDGFSNSIASDGLYAVVSSPYEDENEDGIDFISNAGSAYIYKYENTKWTQVQKIVANDRNASHFFGSSVSISGDYIVVGATGDKLTTLDYRYLNVGAAYIFKNNSGVWEQVQKIVASDRGHQDDFGNSVDIHGNYLVVGASYESEDAFGRYTQTFSGSAYIFKNIDENWTEIKKLSASKRYAYENFGDSVAINDQYVAIGVPQKYFSGMVKNAGAVYIYENNNDQWNNEQVIISDSIQTDRYFGNDIDIYDDYLFVGSYKDDTNVQGVDLKEDSGSVFIYKRQSDSSWDMLQKITASDRKEESHFGSSITASHDYLVIGAYFESEDENSSNYVYHAGAAYIFKKNSNETWSEHQKIVLNNRDGSDKLGNVLAINNEIIFAGVSSKEHTVNDNEKIENAGAVYIFDANDYNIKLFATEDQIFNMTLPAIEVDNESVLFAIGGIDKELFTINENSGILISKNELDYENPTDSDQNNIYDLNVTITDSNGTSRFFVLNIEVEDTNNNPRNIILSQTSINENEANGTIVGSISAQAFTGSNISSYSLYGENEDNALFSIVESNKLKLNEIPNYENKTTYLVGIRVEDNLSRFTDINLSIAVNDINEAPIINIEDTFELGDNAILNKSLITITDDPEKSGNLIYTVDSNDSSLATVYIDSGYLRVDPLESMEGYLDITLSVSDGEFNTTKSIEIFIKNSNDLPELSLDNLDNIKILNDNFKLGKTVADGQNGYSNLIYVLGLSYTPDRKFFFLPSISSKTISVFETDDNSSLTLVQTIENNGLDALGNTVSILDNVYDSKVSPDGKFLYISNSLDTSNSNDLATIGVFSIDQTTGKLTLKYAYSGASVNQGNQNYNHYLAFTPDGSYLYAAEYAYGNTLRTFSVNKTTGELSLVQTIKNDMTLPNLDIEISMEDLQPPTISPDGKFLYILSKNQNTITEINKPALSVFSINQDTGELAFVERHFDAAQDPTNGIEGLNGSVYTKVSNSGKYLYLAGVDSNKLFVFNRDTTTGKLTLQDTLTTSDANNKLNKPRQFAISNNDKTLYLTTESYILGFDINVTTGTPVYKNAFSLSYVFSPIVLSADESFLYFTNLVDGIFGSLTKIDDIQSGTALKENKNFIIDLQASDKDGDTVTFSLGETNDNALFDVNSTTGSLSFKERADFENPTDSDKNNYYKVDIILDDGKEEGQTTTPLVIQVLDSDNDLAPIWSLENNETYNGNILRIPLLNYVNDPENYTNLDISIDSYDSSVAKVMIDKGYDLNDYRDDFIVIVPQTDSNNSITITLSANDGDFVSTDDFDVNLTVLNSDVLKFTNSATTDDIFVTQAVNNSALVRLHPVDGIAYAVYKDSSSEKLSIAKYVNEQWISVKENISQNSVTAINKIKIEQNRLIIYYEDGQKREPITFEKGEL